MTKKKFLTADFICMFFGVLAVVLCAMKNADLGTTGTVICNVILPVFYPFIFMFFGMKIVDDPAFVKKVRKKSLLVYVVVTILYFTVFALVKIKGNSFSDRVFLKLYLAITGAFPENLWFIPASIVSVSILLPIVSKKKLFLGISLFSLFVYIFSCVLLVYHSLFGGKLSFVSLYATMLFGERHCGLFSALLFFVIGIKKARDDKKEDDIGKKVILLCVASMCMAFEIFLIKRMDLDFSSLFLLTTPLFSYAVFEFICCLFSKNGICASMLSEPGIFGVSALIFGQFLCSLFLLLPSLFSSISTAVFTNIRTECELVLLLSFVVSSIICAVRNKNASFLQAFSSSIQSSASYVLVPLGYVTAFFREKSRRFLSTACFALLPLFLWSIEREMYAQKCTNAFKICLVIVMLCCQSYNRAEKNIKAYAFLPVFLSAVIIVVSSSLFRASNYTVIGNVILFIIVPVGIACSCSEEKTEKLLKCFTDGMYISYAAYFIYCSMFRPYDITRYKGAFCNANMNGLYLVVVLSCALYRLRGNLSLKSLKSSFLDCFVLVTSFAYILFSISRTAIAGALCAIAAVIFTVFLANCKGRSVKRAASVSLKSTSILFISIVIGTVFTYSCIRVIPAIVDRPIFLQREIHEMMEYKVREGAPLSDPQYISPSRFFEVFLSRTTGAIENANEYSTGRIDIYLTFLKNIRFFGHAEQRLDIDGGAYSTFAHNAFLQAAFNMGIIPGILWLLLCGVLIIYGINMFKKGHSAALFSVVAITAYSSCGMFESMEIFIYTLLFSALLGIVPIFSCATTDVSMNMHADVKKSDEFLSYKAKLTSKKILSVLILLLMLLVFFWSLRNMERGEGYELLQKTLYGG